MLKMKFALALMMGSSAYALVEKEINEKAPLEVRLSKSSHNRICVEGGSVAKVIGSGSLFSITLDPSTGNAFINLLQELIKEPSTLTVVTSSGLIQDLTVFSKEGPAEQIVLKEALDSEVEAAWSDIPQATTINMLNQILEGKTPFGFGQRSLQNEDLVGSPKGLKMLPLKAYEGPFETIVAYSIENIGKTPLRITSESLKKEGNAWVFLNAHELQPNERAVCIVSNLKGEK